jgi:hypothetical protein
LVIENPKFYILRATQYRPLKRLANMSQKTESKNVGPNRIPFSALSQAELESAGSRHIHIFSFDGRCECGRTLEEECSPTESA